MYDANQTLAVQRVDGANDNQLSIGPSFFESITALGRPNDVEWVYQVPFVSMNVNNSVQGTRKAMEAVPPGRLFALEIGHKPNLYAGVSRADSYDCQHYAAELFKFKVALRRSIRRISSQFSALGLSTGLVEDRWSL